MLHVLNDVVPDFVVYMAAKELPELLPKATRKKKQQMMHKAHGIITGDMAAFPNSVSKHRFQQYKCSAIGVRFLPKTISTIYNFGCVGRFQKVASRRPDDEKQNKKVQVYPIVEVPDPKDYSR